jgi:ABC-2 type transport system permease protein
VLLAVSFLSDEFSTGAIGNWLTFAPRRTRVLLSKLFAAAVATIPYAAVGLAIVIGGSWLVYDHFGEADGGFGDAWVVAGRVLALAVVVSLLGAALGTLSRHTAGALGILLGWVVLVEAILVNIVSSLQPWSVINNISAWVNGGTEYYVNSCTSSSSGQVCSTIVKEISQTHGALVVGGLTALLVVAALLVFRRRDIG